MINFSVREKKIRNLVLRLLLSFVEAFIPLHLSKISYRFLDYSTSAMVIGKQVNLDAGDGLEIPVEYGFFWRKGKGVPGRDTYKRN